MQNVFFIGINGIGMSGLAKIMVHSGYKVYGSDIKVKPITKDLESKNIKVYIGHNSDNIKGMDLVIYSSAIKSNNPEYEYAIENNIPVYKRGELLGRLMDETYTGIAVAGTHGKTTISSMMSVAMLDLDPTVVVGGIIPEIKSNSIVGESKFFVAEADESDKSFLYLYPKYSIISNIEAEHLENYDDDYENLKKAFGDFIEKTENIAIVNKDCLELYEIAKNHKNTVFYSIEDKSAEIYADNIRMKNCYNIFDVYIKGNKIGEFKLKLPGIHNVSNALGVIYLANKLGVDKKNIQEKLKKFKGAKRRFDLIYDNGFKIIDDYAHHPTEVKMTIQAAKSKNPKKLIAVFQPHRYSRINKLLNEFNNIFDLADRVIFLPIYSAGEENTFGLSSEILSQKIQSKRRIENFYDESELYNILKNDSKEGDMYLFMGAGDISSMANDISKRLSGRTDESH